MALTKATYSMIDGALINVLDFGAVGDGVADDTAAIQAAIDSADNLGTVFFPAGTYKITNTLTITYTDVWHAVNLLGVGTASKLDWRGGNGKSMLYVRGISGAGWYSKQYIEKLHFYGNAFTGDPYTNVTAIQLGEAVQNVFSGACNFTVRDCLIRHVTTGVAVFYESDEGIIEANYIERFTGYGVYNYEGGSSVWVTKNHISDGAATSVGVYTSLSSATVDYNLIQGSQFSVGILVAGLGAFRGKAVSIRNNYIESQLDTDYAIALYGTDTAVIENNTINGCRGATLIALFDASDGTPCRNVTIGVNRHTQSGGFIDALASASVNSINCKITGYQQTDGAVDIISGPFQKIYSFDDYEVGPFTAKIFFGATEQTITSFCSYTKIGRLVYVQGVVAMAAPVSGTGAATIENLPFTASASLAENGTFALSVANVTNTGACSATTTANTAKITLFTTNTSGVRSGLTHANFASNSEIAFSGFYVPA